MIAVFRRELKALLKSLYGWGALAALALAAGIGFYVENAVNASPLFTDGIRYCAIGMAVCCGILGCDAFTSARRSHTERIEMGLPVSSAGMFLGKYLARLVVALLGAALLAAYPVALNILAPAQGLAQGLSGVIALAVMGVMFLALALCLSAWSTNVWVSVITYALIVAISWFMPALTSRLAAVTTLTPLTLVLLPAVAGVIIWQLFDDVLAGFIAAAIVEAPVLLSHLNGHDGAVFTAVANGLNKAAVFQPLSQYIMGLMDIGALLCWLCIAAFLIVAGIMATAGRRAGKRRAM